MTVATQEPQTKPKRARKSSARSASPWRRLWQVPLFLAGAVAFAVGLRALVKGIRPVPFETQIRGVRVLLDKGQYDQAIAAINTLGDYYKTNAQQGELQVLSAETHFLAERKLEDAGSIVRLNYERVKDHYRKAVLYGIQPTVEMDEQWGESALATGDAAVGAQKLEEAMAQAGDDAAALIKKHGRELVTTYIRLGRRDAAQGVIDRMLAALPGEADSDQEALETRTWCACRKIEIALGAPRDAAGQAALAQAVKGARDQAMALKSRDHDLMGKVLVWIGRAELEQGDRAAAERDLTDARANFAVHHEDDGRAALMLALVKLDGGDLPGASALFQEVVVGHAGTTLWPAARLGRAMTATRAGKPADETMLADYRFAADTVKETADKPAVGKEPELISADGVRASLIDGFKRAVTADRLVEALAFLNFEKDLTTREPADLSLRLAQTKEQRANELMVEAAKLDGSDKTTRQIEARTLMAGAAEDYIHHGKATTMNDDQSGSSLWKAGELLDRSGETMRAIAVYEGLTIQRPRDARVSEGLLALGRLYASAGMVDKAIEAHERNVRDNPKTPASYASAVAAARSYITRGDHAATPETRDQAFSKAEGLLLGLVQDNTDLEPAALEFRESLLTLGDLYYDWSTRIVDENASADKAVASPAATVPAVTATTSPATAPAVRPYRPARWSDAILRFDEALKRYGNDPAWVDAARTRFLLAESYRKSAAELTVVMEHTPQGGQRDALQKAHADRLAMASQEFAQLISSLDSEDLNAGPGQRKLDDLQGEYLRTAYMDRAACHMERGEYEEAISLYDRAAARFSEELIAVQAYVQIVNAYLMEKQPAQAAAAAERGRWMLKRIPDAAFAHSPVGLTRDYFDKMLALGGA